MKTMVPTIGLSILLLSAGAFANNGVEVSKAPAKVNVTVVYKNVIEPVIPPSMVCEGDLCVDI